MAYILKSRNVSTPYSSVMHLKFLEFVNGWLFSDVQWYWELSVPIEDPDGHEFAFFADDHREADWSLFLKIFEKVLQPTYETSQWMDTTCPVQLNHWVDKAKRMLIVLAKYIP